MMESKKYVSVKEAKEIDMVGYLAKLGFVPKEIRGSAHWYISPLRPHEKTPSFKIDNKLNRWFDHGEGKGGNLVDFGVLFFNCEVKAFLIRLGQDNGSHTYAQPFTGTAAPEASEDRISVLDVKPLTSRALFSYLHLRGIPGPIAKTHCQEVTYQYKNRPYYAIGFKNNEGGYELRSAYAKLSASPKAITTILNGHKSLAVFEGAADFLSYLSLQQHMGWKDHDYLILNSTAFFEQSRELISSYSEKLLFFDNDPTGQKCSKILLASGEGYVDMSPHYSEAKDLNEWLVKNPLSAGLKQSEQVKAIRNKIPKR